MVRRYKIQKTIYTSPYTSPKNELDVKRKYNHIPAPRKTLVSGIIEFPVEIREGDTIGLGWLGSKEEVVEKISHNITEKYSVLILKDKDASVFPGASCLESIIKNFDALVKEYTRYLENLS